MARTSAGALARTRPALWRTKKVLKLKNSPVRSAAASRYDLENANGIALWALYLWAASHGPTTGLGLGRLATIDRLQSGDSVREIQRGRSIEQF